MPISPRNPSLKYLYLSMRTVTLRRKKTKGVETALYRKLPAEIQSRAKKAISIFSSNPGHPSLGHKKMAGQENIYEIRVSDNYRITYQKIENTAYLRKIGTHDLLRPSHLKARLIPA